MIYDLLRQVEIVVDKLTSINILSNKQEIKHKNVKISSWTISNKACIIYTWKNFISQFYYRKCLQFCSQSRVNHI